MAIGADTTVLTGPGSLDHHCGAKMGTVSTATMRGEWAVPRRAGRPAFAPRNVALAAAVRHWTKHEIRIGTNQILTIRETEL